jgi:uncharacterized protein involved in exopolysaccharide biosynthesis
LSAGPVPGSPIFYLHGSGPNANAAIRLANTASAALVAYIRVITAPTPGPKELLVQYAAAENELQTALGRVASREAIYKQTKTARASAALNAARADAQAARIRASTLETSYRQAQADSVSATNLRVIAPATSATSNRRSTIELLGILGAIAGLVFGMALAMLLGRREWRRLRS